MRNLDGSLYDWGKDVTKESFEIMLLRMNVQTFVCEMKDNDFVVYLIDRQRREIQCISIGADQHRRYLFAIKLYHAPTAFLRPRGFFEGVSPSTCLSDA